LGADVAGNDGAGAGPTSLPYPATQLYASAGALDRALHRRLCGHLDGDWRYTAGRRAGGQLVCAAIVCAGGSSGPHRPGLAVLTHQAALSQSLPRSSRTGRLWRCGGSRRAWFRDDTRNLVRRRLLGVDVVGNDVAPRTPRRDGRRVHPDFQRTARTGEAAVLAVARPRQSGTPRGGADANTPACPPVASCTILFQHLKPSISKNCHSSCNILLPSVTHQQRGNDRQPEAKPPHSRSRF